MQAKKDRQLSTLLAQAGSLWDERTGAVSMPLHAATTFRHPALGESTGFDYSRTANPTRSEVEKVLAEFEGGTRALAFSSGMAALDCVFRLFQPGQRIVVLEDLYGGSWRLLETVTKRFGVEIVLVPAQELTPENLQKWAPFHGLFFETPSNPTLQSVQGKALVDYAHTQGALVIVDNTFMTAWWQRPLQWGADVVAYSASKYLGGHNDVLSGVLVTKDVALGESLAALQNTTGAVLGPWDSWLLLRGLKTLPLRLEKQQENAQKLVQWLRQHPSVLQVHYTDQDPVHLSQSKGTGAMISIVLSSEKLAHAVLSRVQVWLFAESLGGVESLITLPARQTHADVPASDRARLGVVDSLLRLSVGVEDFADLQADLAQALEVSP